MIVVLHGLPQDAFAARKNSGGALVRGGASAAGGSLLKRTVDNALQRPQHPPHLPEPEDEEGGEADKRGKPRDPLLHPASLLLFGYIEYSSCCAEMRMGGTRCMLFLPEMSYALWKDTPEYDKMQKRYFRGRRCG